MYSSLFANAQSPALIHPIPAGEFFPARTYGVVLRKGTILTPQAKRFISLLLSSAQEAVNGAPTTDLILN